MKNRLFIFLFILHSFSGYSQRNDQLITSFGAVADGQTNNAVIIQKLNNATGVTMKELQLSVSEENGVLNTNYK
jgi:hypothetical protein